MSMFANEKHHLADVSSNDKVIMDKRNYCVILAGGMGTRLWPMSREKKPKQFIDVLGTGQTLLQMTYERFSRFIDVDNIIIVNNEKYLHWVKEQIHGLICVLEIQLYIPFWVNF